MRWPPRPPRLTSEGAPNLDKTKPQRAHGRHRCLALAKPTFPPSKPEAKTFSGRAGVFRQRPCRAGERGPAEGAAEEMQGAGRRLAACTLSGRPLPPASSRLWKASPQGRAWGGRGSAPPVTPRGTERHRTRPPSPRHGGGSRGAARSSSPTPLPRCAAT